MESPVVGLPRLSRLHSQGPEAIKRFGLPHEGQNTSLSRLCWCTVTPWKMGDIAFSPAPCP